MSILKCSVRILAATWIISFMTACGPSGSSAINDPGTQLLDAQQKINSALNSAHVAAAATGTVAPGCNLIASNAASQNQIPIFKNLQAELETIAQDVQSQDPADLSAEFQRLQDAIMQDLDDLLSQIEDCIPAASASTSTPVPTGTAGSGAIPGLPANSGFDFSQIFAHH